MPRPVEVEFLPEGSEPQPDEELPPPSRRRGFPQWTWVVVAAAVVAALAAAVVTRPSSAGHRAATASSSWPVVVPPPPRQAGEAALDVATIGGRTWTLQDGRLSVSGERGIERVAYFGLDTSDDNGEPRLLVDATAGVVWVVVEDVGVGQVTEFDASRLSELGSTRVPAIAGAAALGGRLYVVSDGRLVEITRTAPQHVVADLPDRRLFAVAADPAHNRVVLSDLGSPTHVWSYRPGSALAPVGGPLPFAKGSLAVAAGRVWVGGYSSDGAVLERIGPGRPLASPLAGQLGTGALVVGAGQHVVWVRSGAGGDDLWCVDATTGRAVQHWSIQGQIASTGGTAVVATDSGATQLRLIGCRG